MVPAAPKDATKPLLVLAAAGRFDPVELQVQFAGEDGKVLGAISFADLGPSPAWRNLRMSRDAIPTQATRIRLLVTDDDLAPQHWVAITPPRVPSLRSLQAVVGSDPVFLDWLVGLAFPCQRPFGHKNGVIEIPKWRILPDRFGAEANSPVMDYLGGARWASPNCSSRPPRYRPTCRTTGSAIGVRCNGSRRITGTPPRRSCSSVLPCTADSGHPDRCARAGSPHHCPLAAFR